MDYNSNDDSYKAGIISIVGKTNVGKSTLLNNILDEKVSIVTDRVQTTRNLIRAIYTSNKGQLVFLDTPGIHKAKGNLGRNMNKIARSSIDGVDIILIIFDVSSIPNELDEGWFRRLSKSEIKYIFVLNKIDCSSNFENEYRKLWYKIKNEKKVNINPDWLKISALKNIGLDNLIQKLIENVPKGPKLFPDNILTDYPKKLNIADVIREKLFFRLHQELPHALAVWVVTIEELQKKCNVCAIIYVERHSQKGIVIGEKGKIIKAAQKEAEKELYEMYAMKYNLKLTVKVEKNWRKNFWMLKKFGYS